jgi:hypothetical protein
MIATVMVNLLGNFNMTVETALSQPLVRVTQFAGFKECPFDDLSVSLRQGTRRTLIKHQKDCQGSNGDESKNPHLRLGAEPVH